MFKGRLGSKNYKLMKQLGYKTVKEFKDFNREMMNETHEGILRRINALRG